MNKKIVIIPDSFKGTMSSLEVSGTMKKIIQKEVADAKVFAIPIADGGEGTLECFSCIKNVSCIKVPAKNALMQDILAPYIIYDDTAVLETATVAGFSSDRSSSNPLVTTTYGLGLLIKDAVKHGARKIIIGLGGSCTNDGGAGMAAAIGTHFYDSDGNEFIPVGGSLSKVASIDQTDAVKLLDGVEIIGMCDVTNPMYGPTGAAYVFAPQKGASPNDVIILDHELQSFEKVIRESLQKDVASIEGSGAAGALGAGICAFLNGQLIKGIDIVLDMIDFDSLIQDAAYVITGEGKFDSQSLRGKVVSGVCDVAKRKGVPVIVITGMSDVTPEATAELGIKAIFETGPVDFTQPRKQLHEKCLEALNNTTQDICQFINGDVEHE